MSGIDYTTDALLENTRTNCLTPEADALALEKLSYREKRAREYPSIGDQLDAIWKGGAALDEMRAKVTVVKAKYPKPEYLKWKEVNDPA